MAPKKEQKSEEIDSKTVGFGVDELSGIMEVVGRSPVARAQLAALLGGTKFAGFRRVPPTEGITFNQQNPEPTVETFVAQLRSHFELSLVDLTSAEAVKLAGNHLRGEAAPRWHATFGQFCERFDAWSAALVD